MLTFEEVLYTTRNWLNGFAFGPDPKKSVYVDSRKVTLKLYTFVNDYTITVYKATDDPVKDDYKISLSATSRRFRAGEWWSRTRSLLDSRFDGEALNNILRIIVSYECVDPVLSAEESINKKKK